MKIEIIAGILHQWDIGRRIRVVGADEAVSEIHFAHHEDENAIVVVPSVSGEKITAKIPDILLQSGSDIAVYLVNCAEGIERTIGHRCLHVVERPKPDNYVYTEEEVLTYKALEERVKKLEEDGTGGVDEEQIADAVKEYLEENPIEGGNVSEEQISQAVENYMEENPIDCGISPVEKTDDMTQPVGIDENGQLWVAPIGGGGDTPVVPGSHGIVWDLLNVSSSNNAVSIADGGSLVAVLTANDGYTLGDVTITMGGEVLTGAWNPDTATIVIASVTGDVIISCVATMGVDTTAVIAEYDKGYSDNRTLKSFAGVCATKIYEFNPDIEGIKASVNYDAENDYVTTAGAYGGIKVYTPTVKFREAGYSITGITGGASKMVLFNDGVATTHGSNASFTTSTPSEAGWQFARQNSEAIYSNGVAFSLSILDIDDSYAYWYKPLANTVLPIGVHEGDIIFAGKNTPYYGLANIDGTKHGEQSTGELSLDDDFAMNYAVATTSVLGDEPNINPSVAYGLSKEFTDVITSAKKEWMAEYAGDFRKIPIIVSTDQHGRRSDGIFNLIGKTFSMHDISKVMNLGDTISTWYDKDAEHPLLCDSGLEAWCDSVKAIPFSKQLNVYGNHDTWYGNYEDEGNPIGTRYPSTQTHLYQYFRNVYARRTNNNGWFVVHDDQFNVKYLVVSAFEYRSSVTFRIGTEQMKFIIEEMEKNDGYDIVIVSHIALYSNPDLNFYPTGQTSTTTFRISELDTDALFSARKTKGSGTITDSDGVEHSYDFTKCESEVLCSLHGHTHDDEYLYLNDRLLVNSFDWFDDYTFFLALIDRVNRKLNVWKIEAPDGVPTYQRYDIPFDKPTE